MDKSPSSPRPFSAPRYALTLLAVLLAWTGLYDARRDNSPGSGAISSSKSLLHICQQNYKKAKGEGNPSPFLFTVYSVSFSRSASTAVSLPRLIS